MEVGAVIAKIASESYQQYKQLPSPAVMKSFLLDGTNLESWLPGSVPNPLQKRKPRKKHVEVSSEAPKTLKRKASPSLQGRRHTAFTFHNTSPGTHNGQVLSSSEHQGTLDPVQTAGAQGSATTLAPDQINWDEWVHDYDRQAQADGTLINQRK
ncbi:hypothetical protein H0H93_000896 [Arthromyces matolae]|nr:hypothetical protein H0H93_000896 [Arthromyces matolae]